ncbi:hypothetical protein U7154_000023 [Kononvirus KKP3711]|uniref:Phage protein n=1 Tax=Enterobacter phage KKP_3711 TaxID=3109398 RepID=A0AAX4Q4U5_9CAUD
MCKVNKETATLIEQFVHGYIAGSCNSFDESLNVLHFSLTEKGIKISLEDLEMELSQALEDAEVFCCPNCNWFCYEHDRSENGELCRDCDPDEEE